ncbi:MAG TPA: hypothetical protein VF491_17485 [Vicinamibacterales bacterium]
MANRERGELRLIARDRVYTLRLTVEWCCELEDRTDRPLKAIIVGINGGSAADLRWLVWASLQAKHEKELHSVEAIGDLIDLAGGIDVVAPVVSTFMQLNGNDDIADDDSISSHDEPAEEPGSQWRRLYLDARTNGLSPERFWRLSIRELWLELAADRRRQKHRRERDLSLAWWTESLARQKRLPSLEKLIGRATRQARKTQNWQQMKAMMTALAGVSPTDKKRNDGHR